jgi:hypothetical protein
VWLSALASTTPEAAQVSHDLRSDRNVWSWDRLTRLAKPLGIAFVPLLSIFYGFHQNVLHHLMTSDIDIIGLA